MPECNYCDVKTARFNQLLRLRPKSNQSLDAALLQQAHVTLATVPILGNETHHPTGLLQEFNKMENTTRTALSIEFRHSGCTDQRSFGIHPLPSLIRVHRRYPARYLN